MSDERSLQGQHVLVTGGTRGIGRAIALELANAGAEVTAIYARNDTAAHALAAQAEAASLRLSVLRADLTSAKGMAAVIETAAQRAPDHVLSLVHAAATGVHRPVKDLTLRHWDWTHALNVRACFELVTALMPRWGRGSGLVLVSSAGAVRAVRDYAAIGSSKGALEALARHLAVELAPRGARVNVVAPGSVLTQAWDAFPDRDGRVQRALERSPIGRMVTPEDVAQVARFLLSPAATAIIGQTLVVDGGAGLLE